MNNFEEEYKKVARIGTSYIMQGDLICELHLGTLYRLVKLSSQDDPIPITYCKDYVVSDMESDQQKTYDNYINGRYRNEKDLEVLLDELVQETRDRKFAEEKETQTENISALSIEEQFDQLFKVLYDGSELEDPNYTSRKTRYNHEVDTRDENYIDPQFIPRSLLR